MTIAREGFPFIIPAAVLGVLLLIFGYAMDQQAVIVIGWALTLLTVLFLFFFREPQFEAFVQDGQILAPADGKVLTVDSEVPENLSPLSTRLSIFLSVFDVHVNRIPADGEIASVEFRQGRKYSAFRPQASIANQRSEIDLDTKYGRIHFRQITGSVARRVVFSVVPGQKVKAGERFGVMRFGSRMDLFFPESVEVLVKTGDRVKAGCTVVAEFRK